MHLNALRTKKNNITSLQDAKYEGHNVPAVAIHTYWKNFQEPSTDEEDIDSIYTIQYEPAFITTIDDTNDNIKNGLKEEDFLILL